MSTLPCTTLSNGVKMPLVGSGTNTFGKINHAYEAALRGDTREMDDAIANGYRHFDTAQSYRTEGVVGTAIRRSGVPRQDYFLTSKLATSDGYRGEAWVHASIQATLERLQTDYVDLFLIHHPWDNPDEIVEVWKLLEAYYKKGTFRALGVSNFSPDQWEMLLRSADVAPTVNQIESHPGKWQHAWIEAQAAHDIVTVAWSPLAGIEGNVEAVLSEIGTRYGKTPQQVALRYQVQRGVVVIPKSHNRKHQAESLAIFDFALTPEECERIASL